MKSSLDSVSTHFILIDFKNHSAFMCITNRLHVEIRMLSIKWSFFMENLLVVAVTEISVHHFLQGGGPSCFDDL